MRRFSLRLSCIALGLAACSEDAPPPQPAPPADRNFTATVDDRPVVGGTQNFACLINTSTNKRVRQFLLTFTDDMGHTIQVGIEAGDEQRGPRAIVSGMATAEGRAYGRPHDASAELGWIEATATGAIVSGRFSAIFDQVNAAPGITDHAPLKVTDAAFEQVECLDPKLADASTSAR
ncbi:MAG: hypothetical protein IT478_07235 [Xanthomonadales bacterium]|nr:hypothetical protein [Xanthomonadales bacterium]MCC6561131.1 hypothetical protein [Xanthomonadales bacterium]